MISGYVSAKQTIAKLYRDLGINEQISETSIYEWIGESLSLIGAYAQFNEVSDCLTLNNGRVKLPCDFYKLVDISYKGYPVYWATNTNAANYQCDNCQVPICSSGQCQYTFYLNDSYLISNIRTNNNQSIVETENPSICIVYLAMPVDEEGYPMIPDNVYFQKAIVAYITYMLDRQDWRKGKCTDKVKEESEKEWMFYVGAAKGAANMPNTQQMERIKNVWRRMLPLTNDYDRNFINLGRKEKRNIGQ